MENVLSSGFSRASRGLTECSKTLQMGLLCAMVRMYTISQAEREALLFAGLSPRLLGFMALSATKRTQSMPFRIQAKKRFKGVHTECEVGAIERPRADSL